MADGPVITVAGNLTADPELRFSPSGQAVANFTVAHTPRTFDRQSNEWKDGETLFLRASIWREAAENMAESLVKGDRVIVTGALVSRTYDTKDGRRTVLEMRAEEVGASLRYAQARPQRVQKGANGPGVGKATSGWGTPATAAPAASGWGAPPQHAASGWGTPDEAPPF